MTRRRRGAGPGPSSRPVSFSMWATISGYITLAGVYSSRRWKSGDHGLGVVDHHLVEAGALLERSREAFPRFCRGEPNAEYRNRKQLASIQFVISTDERRYV